MENKFELKKFIKAELSGWNKFEVGFLILIYTIVTMNAIILKDNPFAVTAAICGATATMTAGKGKVSCYIFGIFGTLCYSYMSLIHHVYGNFLLNIAYYFPMQFFGIFEWMKNLNPETQEIIKRKLSKKDFIIISIITTVIIAITTYILYLLKDVNPLFDAITTILSILGLYFTVKRFAQQWIVWAIVNGLTLTMWIKIVLNGQKAYSTVVMWAAYFIIGIYFLIKWYKELSSKEQ